MIGRSHFTRYFSPALLITALAVLALHSLAKSFIPPFGRPVISEWVSLSAYSSLSERKKRKFTFRNSPLLLMRLTACRDVHKTNHALLQTMNLLFRLTALALVQLRESDPPFGSRDPAHQALVWRLVLFLMFARTYIVILRRARLEMVGIFNFRIERKADA